MLEWYILLILNNILANKAKTSLPDLGRSSEWGGFPKGYYAAKRGAL